MVMSALPPSLALPTPKPPKNTNNHFNSLQLQSCLSLLEICKYTTEFKQVHATLTKHGLIHHPLALTRLLCYSSISHHSDINYARSVFNLDRNPNAFAYNVVIRGYAQSEEPENSLALFCSMLCSYPSSVPNNLTFPFVLKACSRVKAVEEGKQVHGLVFKFGLGGDVFVQNSLISMYAACGLVDFACQVFDKMSDPDVVSWNSVIKGLVDSGFVEEGRRMFDRMPKRSSITWNCLIDGYVKTGALDEARALFDQMEAKDTVSWNTLIDGYVGSGLMEDATDLFRKMPRDTRDVISFNLMIDGYARAGRYKEVLEMFREMREARVEPTLFTVVSVLKACSCEADLEQGEWMQAYIERNRINVDAVLGTALVDMFSKCGDIDRAVSVFKSIKERDAGAWNAMIYNLGIHGHVQEALTVFDDMLRSNVAPDEITFLGLLSACRHSGRIEEGKRCFELMSEEYGLAPKVEHYACMVDLLCRSDHLEEARDLIETSEVKSSVPMWGALLGASCRLRELAMAEDAAKHLLELDPLDGSCYIILSNMYAAAGLYDKAIDVRNRMKEKGLEKVPGTSSIEIENSVHEFRVSSTNYLE